MKKIITCLAILIMSVCNAQKNETLILEDGNYFDGKIFVPFKEILIKGTQIISISDKKSQAEGQRMSVKGKFVIPGLIDSHVHASGSPAYPYTAVDPLLNAGSSLMCGVTSNIDLFFEEGGVKSFKEEIALHPEKYSSMIMSGPILTAPGGHGTEYGVPTRTIASVTEAEKATNEVASKKEIDVIKLVYQGYSNKNTLTKEMVKTIVETAHKHHKKVLAHIDDAKGANDCIEAGVDALAHIPYNAMSEAELAQLKKSGILMIPTITVYQSVLEGQSAAYMSDSLLWRTAHPDYMESFNRKGTTKLPGIEKFFPEKPAYRDNLKNCIKNNIPVLAGTDAGNFAVFYGYSLHNEIQQYCKEGMTASGALCSATQNILLLLPELKIGKISPGFDADIVVLNANPLDNIENTKQIDFVLHKGKIAQKIDLKRSPPKAAIEFNSKIFDWNSEATLPGYISAYTDALIGGTSKGSVQFEKDGTVNTLHLTGDHIKNGFVGFVGMGINLSKKEEEIPVKLNEFKYVEFDVRGNDQNYDVVMGSNLVKDFNYHKAPFKPAKEWKTIKISFADFKQNPWYGKKLDLDLQTITSLSFETSEKSCPVDLQIKNLRFAK